MSDWFDIRHPTRIVILACSRTKRAAPEPMNAIDRYDGPMWQTLRALLARHATAAAALASRDMQIWALSARFGLIRADTECPNYDLCMTPALMEKMRRDPSYDLQRIPALVDDAQAVLFAGGELYRDAMWKASGQNLWNIMKITETDGRGIGEHRAQLGAWFASQFGASDEPRLAA